MCGIFGVIAAGSDRLSDEQLSRAHTALASLERRGPDSKNFKVHRNVFMGHTRLSIIDLSERATQPLVSISSGNMIAANGEIYGFQKVRERLGPEKFSSQSDTEVLLVAYDELGLKAALDQLDGMYAAAILDVNDNCVHLVRDRAGIKPLYYGWIDGCFVWSSELKAIESFANEAPLVDVEAIFDFAVLRYLPTPKTIYKGLHKLPPAHSLTICLNSSRVSKRKYWSLETDTFSFSHEELSEQLLELLEESVQDQLVADVPVGVLLSSGIDSSSIASIASELSDAVKTFTVGFGESSQSEADAAWEFAKDLGTEHYSYIENFSIDTDTLPCLRDWYDEPFGDLSAFPTELVCRSARRNCKVALSGDGGDELFGGYIRYEKIPRLWRSYRNMRSSKLTNYVQKSRGLLPRKVLKLIQFATEGDILWLYNMVNGGLSRLESLPLRRYLEIKDDYDPLWALRDFYNPNLGDRRSIQYMEFHTWLPDSILTKVDRVSMLNGLEVRVPFLSRKISEFAFRCPESFIYLNGVLKGGLRASLQEKLPQNILTRGKQGFGIPKSHRRSSQYGSFTNYQRYYAQKVINEGVNSVLPRKFQ